MFKQVSECIPGDLLLPADDPVGHEPASSQGGAGFFCYQTFEHPDQRDLFAPVQLEFQSTPPSVVITVTVTP